MGILAQTINLAPFSPQNELFGAISPQNAKQVGQKHCPTWSSWSRGLDLNQRPPGYEPGELPDCSTPHHLVPFKRQGYMLLALANCARGKFALHRFFTSTTGRTRTRMSAHTLRANARTHIPAHVLARMSAHTRPNHAELGCRPNHTAHIRMRQRLRVYAARARALTRCTSTHARATSP